MLDPSAIPAIEQREILARFVLYSNHKRADGTVKPDAFIPAPGGETSVTRHREATQDEIWNEANRVAKLREKRLYGRADVSASACTAEGLCVKPDPDLPWNPNHAVVTDWPENKPAQKLKAIEIARKAMYLPTPTS